MENKQLEVGTDPMEGFTSTQRERYSMLSSIYGKNAATAVRHLKRSGPSSYASVYEKAVKVNKAKSPLKEYYTSLSEEFEAHKKLSDDLIIRLVTETREEHDLPPFLKRIKTQCLQEFYNLFIFEEVVNETNDDFTSELKEYKPLFRLLAD